MNGGTSAQTEQQVQEMVPIPEELEQILAETPELHHAYLVGGCVRDALLGHPGKDFDIEVFGVGYDQLVAGLSRWGRTDLVGRSFGVAKLSTTSRCSYDFTIPRADSKVSAGHKGFEVKFDPAITPEQAASRRDFTINALMYDPRQRKVLDFFGGVEDLRSRVLRHTSSAFPEDPLRVLRGMQLAGRFGLSAAEETIELCRRIKNGYHELAVERVREEWFKWAQRSCLPSAGLHFLAQTEWMDHFPEIKSMIGTPQEPIWHPEGDVFVHTCHCCDVMAKLPGWLAADPESKAVYMFAILTHDFGKPPTTHRALKDGEWRIVSPGHEQAGVELAERFFNRINMPLAIRQRVIPLIVNHLFHFQTITDRAVRRLAKRLEPENIDGLCLLMTADSLGRPPRPPTVPERVTRLLERAHELQVKTSPPKPILMGRHLLELGFSPGPQVGEIVNAAYDAQLEGVFFDLPHALEWVREQRFELPDKLRGDQK